MVAADSHYPFPQAGEINVSPLKKTQRIANKGVQEKQRSWAPPVGTFQELEGAVNTDCLVTSRPRSGDAPLKEVGELPGLSLIHI